jgi:hypothetical protein
MYESYLTQLLDLFVWLIWLLFFWLIASESLCYGGWGESKRVVSSTFLQLFCNFLQNQSIIGQQLSLDFEAKGLEVYHISLSSVELKHRARSCKINKYI